ncbi:hypothetical protein ILUMI_09333 [Ignelater luminosus]|uniref:Uncharacterized protein n=1 Tax=Ignelater luminosus TaxID=2038154 RepID=A0A8K0CZZ4_IGNLU|nr:hypothetical protein ILUMI_09333 [Ignelater luminosus]
MASVQIIILVVVAHLSLSLGTTTDQPALNDEVTNVEPVQHEEALRSTKQPQHDTKFTKNEASRSQEVSTGKPAQNNDTDPTEAPSKCNKYEDYMYSYDPKCEPTCSEPIKILCLQDHSNLVSPYCRCILGFLRNNAHKCVHPLKCFL